MPGQRGFQGKMTEPMEVGITGLDGLPIEPEEDIGSGPKCAQTRRQFRLT